MKATRQGPALSIDALAQRRAINPEIYGMNFAPEALAAELKLPVRRWGGNHTSRYNWQNDTWNAAADWYFENIAEENANPAALPDGSAVDRFVEQDRRTGTRSLVSMPMIGWVAKRRLESAPYDCSFKVSKYGAQKDTDVWDRDCGNGVRPDGSFITGNDPTDASVAVGPDFISAWIRHLTGKYGTAATGGVAYYALDNEPMLWHETHRDVHPQKVTYDEIRDRSYLYGAAIKAADPSAKTFGPLEWGWCGYLYSAADGCAAGADYRAHGSTNFAPWYLQQMRAYEQEKGVRLLDYFDLHYYPEQAGVALGTAGNATTKALRLRSTRALWDPTYIDESWISDLQPGGIAIRLIPRMRDWIAAHYPGTKLSITEYNFGGLEDINGALAQADVLGIFGREGVDLAMLWDPPSASQPGAYAFRMYRNYDGAGGAFGETAVKAASADQGQLAVYAAQRAQDGALTIMVINKTADELTSTVGLAGFSPQATAAVYRYSAAILARIERPASPSVTAAGFEATFPANSITLLVLLPAGPSDAGVQGLWWAGMAENGWGMSITQHGSMLFSGLYVYDSAGKPSWAVMPAGTWNASRTAFTGNLYIPTGSWYGAYDAAKFVPGNPVGTATITFNGANDAALDYVINGVAGSKRIVRQMFGPVDTTPVANYEDLWWGGVEQNGWGVAITQQYRTLFAVWYTYDTAGKVTWFVMSGGTWTAAGTYTGTAYRTTGSPWLGATYDPARFVVTDVGKVTFTFANTSSATMTYTIDGLTQSKAITRQPF